MSLRKISSEELQDILRLHKAFAEGNLCGVLASLGDTDLRGVDLSGAYLQGAILQDAILQDVNLAGANLQGADLQDANLQDANLQDADLRGANLYGAYFRHSYLYCADLRGALCDTGISEADCLLDSRWLLSDVPWWLGHQDQHRVILSDQ